GIIVVLGIDEKCEELFYKNLPIALALIIVGIAFIIVETCNKKEPKINSIAEITYKTAFIIGMFQVLAAMFPGVSRSGATIIGALLIGVSRKTAAEFTFFLAVPVMFGASLLKLLDFGTVAGTELAMLIIGMVSAFIVSIIIIKFLLGYIKKHDFKAFAYYRIAIGIVIIALLCI
nr:undecaprenyl-diphosphate phosphatase [Lachnospiraceae bacterium]